MRALLAKEWLELVRSRRLLVLCVVLLFFGILSPLTARYMGDIFAMMSESMQGIVIQLPEPSIHEAIVQYLANFSENYPLAIILVAMACIVAERERGTLAMVLARPVIRWQIVLSKYLALLGMLLIALALGGLGALYYSIILFGGPAFVDFLLLNLAGALYLSVILALTVLASTLARSTVAAGALSLGFWLTLSLVGSLPGLRGWLPPALVTQAAELGLGSRPDVWQAALVALTFIGVALAGACLALQRQEL
ncbi:MAG: ABC transporter permease subunit [Chloroflexi bacterium]|nr:ABC transporter permease subunit [Chloroflexota bacterium]